MFDKFWTDFFMLVAGFLSFCMIIVAVTLAIDANRNQDLKIVVSYDCRLAEISPDYPVIVKNECRKLSAKGVKIEN